MLKFAMICFKKLKMRMDLSNYLQGSSIVQWMMEYKIFVKYLFDSYISSISQRVIRNFTN